jgi:hypothetical protein
VDFLYRNQPIKEINMSKLIPAVFFQKQLNGVEASAKKPEVLELYESEMQKIVGGRAVSALARGISAGSLRFSDPDAPPDGSGGSTTYSGSEGWLDVAQADDCGF